MRRLATLLLSASLAWSADAPTQLEWAPVAAQLNTGDAAGLVAAQNFAELYPAWPGAPLALAESLMRSGNYQAAMNQAASARKRAPNDVRPLALILLGLYHLNRHADCLQAYDRLEQEQRDADGSLAWTAGLSALASEHYDRAVQLAGLSAERGFSGADSLRGIALLSQGKATEAAQALRLAVQRQADDARAWYALGLPGLLQAEDALPQEALQALEKAAASENAQPQIRLALGLAQLRAGRLEDAERNISGAASKEPSSTAVIAQAATWNALARRDQNTDLFRKSLETLLTVRDADAARLAWLAQLVQAALGAGNAGSVQAILANADLTSLPAITRGLARLLLAQEGSDPARALTYAQQAAQDLDAAAESRSEDAALQRARGDAHWLVHTYLLGSGQTEAADEAARLAAGSYRAAVLTGDWTARVAYLAAHSARGAKAAVPAALECISWRPLDFLAWKVLLTNYGASEAWKRPLHLGAWGLLLLVFLIFGLKRSPVPTQRGSRSKSTRTQVGRAGSTTNRSPSSATQRARQLSPAVDRARRPAGEKLDETFLPKSMIQNQSPLEKQKSSMAQKPSRMQQATNDETLLPGTMAPGQRGVDRALDANKKGRIG